MKGEKLKMNLKGKRLLILGGTGYFCKAIEYAKSQGVYTIVTDYFINSPAKKIADKSYNISTTDIKNLQRVIEEEKIDGIFVGWSDINHYIAEKLCRKYKFPFYATKEQLYNFTNKKAFKALCHKCNVPVVPEYDTKKLNDLAYLESINFPVIVKPVDSYGGKGITICDNIENLKLCIENALQYSKTGEYIIEKYMDDKQYDTIGVYYSIQDGKIALSSMTDRYMYEFDGVHRLNAAIFYPSQYLDRYLQTTDNLVKNMIKNSNIKNGTMFFEGCVNASGFYFWESGFRLCGAQQNIFPNYFNNVDVQNLLINFALTGKMDNKNLMYLEDPFFKGKFACNGLIFLKKGKISTILGIEEIAAMQNVINFTQLKQVGDIISEEMIGTLNQSFARFHIVADSKPKLYLLIRNVFNKLRVTDENDNNLIIYNYDFSIIDKEKIWK